MASYFPEDYDLDLELDFEYHVLPYSVGFGRVVVRLEFGMDANRAAP